MICAIHQPDYIPYLGYFYKMSRADVFVYLDDAQYSKGDRHEYNEIKAANGRTRLKIPIKYRFGDPMTAVIPNYERHWLEDHLSKISDSYADSEWFGDIARLLLNSAARKRPDERRASLADMNVTCNTEIGRRFGFECEFCRSSSMGIDARGNQRLINICKAVGADTYLSGTGATAYMDEKMFADAGIKVIYSDYEPKEYPQKHGAFIENLSVVDFILNCGYDFAALYGRK